MSQTDPTTSPWQAAPTRLLEWTCITMMLVLIFDVLWGVISRFLLRAPSRWTDELATFLLIWIAMLGAALAHREGSHLGVVWLAQRLDPPIARWVRRFVHVMVVLFAMIVMIYGGALLVQDRFRSGQVLPALGWPKAWMYLAVPVAGLFIIAYSLWELFRPPHPVPTSAPQEQPTPPPPGSAREDGR